MKSGFLFTEDRLIFDDPEILPPSAVPDLIEEAARTGKPLGIDFECDDRGKPTAIGVSTGSRAAAAWWHAVYADLLMRYPGRLVGYASISADRRILGDPDWRRWEDSMLIHYLNHQDLCAMPGKSSSSGDDGEEGELGTESYGFMNLWTATALTATVANWKRCRGLGCSGPCPRHEPLSYCAMDAWAALTVFHSPVPPFLSPADRLRKYNELKHLSYLATLMEEKGVLVDWEYVQYLSGSMEAEKERIPLPFNPRSPKAALDWFAAHGLRLPDARLTTLVSAADAWRGSTHDPDSDGGRDEVARVLSLLIEYKMRGKGLKAWFDHSLRGPDDRIHPRVIVCGTSTGRLAMSRPNLQNVPRLRWGRAVRDAIIAPAGHVLLKADFSQLELRVCLHLAGCGGLGQDAFLWLVENSGGAFDRAASITGQSPRDVAKSVSHAGDYLEGLTLIEPAELESARIRKAEEAGALEVHRDWHFRGKIVAFTGVNLARRLFGSSTLDHRRRALEIQRAYFSAFPALRAWQKRVLEQVESSGVVVSPYGRYLDLTALEDVEKAKVAVAFLGQGVGADLVQAAMIRLHGRYGIVPSLQVHDELVIEVPEAGFEKLRREIAACLEEPDQVLGLAVPAKIKTGKRWGSAQ